MMLVSYFLALSFVAGHVFGATNEQSQSLDAGFDKLVEGLMAELKVPGVSIALITKEKVTAKGYGFSQLPSVEATPDTLWFTGSTTKAFVAAAAAKIIQNQTAFPDVKWSTPLSKLLPDDFALADDYYSSHITLEDALSHRSGLPRHDTAYGWDNATTTETIRTMRYMPLTAEPRTRWQYCNLMYATVGEIVQRLAGQKLETVLREWYWKPLGMQSTTFSVGEAQRNKDHNGDSKLAKGYFWDGGDFVPEAITVLDGLPGAGATISSVNDYVLWMQAHLAAYVRANVSSPVTASIYRAVTFPRSVMEPEEEVSSADTPLYALGWVEMNIGCRRLVTHGGAVTGFGTQVYLLPDEGIGFVSMANTMGTSNILGATLFLDILKKSSPFMATQEQQDIEQLLRNGILHAGHGPHPLLHDGNQEKETEVNKSRAEPSIPLSGALEDYAGLYVHPAYGAFNVSIAGGPSLRSHRDSPSQRPIGPSKAVTAFANALMVQPSLRTWPMQFVLSHDSSSLFTKDDYWLHGENTNDPDCDVEDDFGTPQLKCKRGVVPQLIDRGRAAFEYSQEATVARLGLELESELVRQAREDGGPGNWRAGMIWFDHLL